MQQLEPGARCAAHDEVPAVLACKRCGTFCCADCVEVPASERLCLACAARSDDSDVPAHSKAVVAVLLGFFGLALLPLSFVAVAMALWALKLDWAKAWRYRVLGATGLVLGLVGVVLTVVAVVVLVRNGWLVSAAG